EVDRIGSNVVPIDQLLLPGTRVVVEANEPARPGAHAAVMQEREIAESKLSGDLVQEKAKVFGACAAARLLLEQIGEPRSTPLLARARQSGLRQGVRVRGSRAQPAPHRKLRWHSAERLSSSIGRTPLLNVFLAGGARRPVYISFI